MKIEEVENKTRNLKQVLNHGLALNKDHRVIKLNQNA